MIGNIGAGELLIILFIILLVFGGKKLPEMARSLGRSLSEFRHATSSAVSEIKDAIEQETPESRKKTPHHPVT